MVIGERRSYLDAYRADFCRRTKEARERAGFTQEEIAEILGIPRESYSKYEFRSCMPHDLLGKFCNATGIDLYVLITGERRSGR